MFLFLGNLYSQQQLGPVISGENAGDYFGENTAINIDGSIIAGFSLNNSNSKGHVRVFQYTPTGVTSWTQLGSDIDGKANNDSANIRNGSNNISLNSAGNILAFGTERNDDGGDNAGLVRVYIYNSGTSSWDQLGSDLTGENAGDYFGTSVGLSDDGYTLVVSADQYGGTNIGAVYVYQYVSSGGSSGWTLKGSRLEGENSTDYKLGNHVSINSDGTVIAASSRGAESSKGEVKVFTYNQSATSSWTQLGSDIVGESASDHSGDNFSLSSDGYTIAIGAPYNDGGGNSSGHVRVYGYTPSGTSSWTQLGADIDGESSSDIFGDAVSISADGLTLAVGARQNEGGGTQKGSVRIFKYTPSGTVSWTKFVGDIDLGTSNTSYFGESVSLSKDGTRFVAGACLADDGGTNAGFITTIDFLPKVTFTFVEPENLVSGSDVVTITATFSEAMAASPTINITGEVNNVIMTASSTSAVWIYPWTVSTTTSGIVSATVSGSDLSGFTYSGTDSITFTIDNSRPYVISTTVTNNLSVDYISQSGTNTITVVFNEKIDDDTFTVSDVTILPTGFSITPYSSSDYISFSGNITATNTLSFSGTVTLTLNENSIEDLAGNLNTVTTTTFLFDNIPPTLSSLIDTDLDNLVSGSSVVTITTTFSESMTATPTINITGEVSNVAMTASSSASVWIYPWTVSTTTSGIVSATVSAKDLANNVCSGTESITFTIDNTAPTVALTDTDSNNIVTGSNVVTITATFSEAMTATPTINITGEVTNEAMTASSTASVWIYPWTVSTTTSGIVSATVSGTDISGLNYSGTDSITFTIDNTAPTVTLTDTDSNNTVAGSNVVTITATFNEALSSSPTINITGEVSNVPMTASSTTNVWIYPWTVSTTTSGIVSASVSGTNLSGLAYSGTDSITFTISQTIYFENNICKCPNATVGDSTTISGTTYIAVNNSTIGSKISAGNYNLCTTLATSMTELFYGNSSFNSDILFWDMSNVTNTDRMFQGASSFNQDIRGWNTSKFYDVSGMFKSASSFNQNIGGWDTSRIANMANMFDYASSFNQDLTSWCVSRISSEPSAFAGNTSALTNANKPIWGTCGKLTSSDTDNYVTPSTTVTITAEYNKTSTNTPQISITSVVTNTNMTPVTGINSFTYNWLVSSALADGKYYATLSGKDLYNNTYSGSNSITFTIDNTAPTVTLSDTDSDNLVSASNLVTITAIFNEALSTTPTINISGQVSNVAMTASSTTNVWLYSWTVDDFDGQTFVTVSGSDIYSNAYSGTDSITFKDLIPPQISTTSVQNQNEYVDITFDQPVYGNTNASSSIASSSFSIVQTSGSSLTLNILGFRSNNSTIFSSASQLLGGETSIRIFMDLSSLSPIGSEVYSVSATNSSSIFDINGNGMLTSQSSSFTLKLPISGPVNPIKSEITLTPDEMIANGSNITVVKVQAKDSLGLSFFSGGDDIIIFNSSGDLPTTDNQDGTYSVNFVPEEINLATKEITFGFRVAGINSTRSALLTLHQDKDGDGVYSINDLCPATKEGLEVDEDGCALYQKDTDKDGVFDDLDQCPDTPELELNNIKGTPGYNTKIRTIVDEKGCGKSQIDSDGDGIVDNLDNCIETANPNQLDTDGDSIGDVCDTNNPLPEITSTEIKFVQLPPNGAVVGKIEAIDVDKETLTFSQLGTNFTNVLSIAADGTVTVVTGVSLDYNSQYNGARLGFTVSDGTNEVESSIIILLEDKPRPPEINIITFEVSEDAAVGTLVGLIEVSDPMGGQIVSVDFSGDGYIELINGNELKTVLELDYEEITAHPFTITAKASDQSGIAGLTGSKSESVRVIDIPNKTYTGRFFISIFNVIDETLGAKVGYRRYFNPHNKGVGKWKVKKKIKGGADASKFTIKSRSIAQQKTDEVIEDENEDYLAFITPPDFENPGDANKDNIYEVEVEYINTADGQPEVPISVTQRNIRVPEGKFEAIELQSQPVLPTDDNDGDGIVDILDNSPLVSNPEQNDEDGDGVGDVTDDIDHDGVWNPFDICPDTPDGELVGIDGCLIYYLPPNNFSISKTEKCAGQNSINLSVIDTSVTYNVSVSGGITSLDTFTGNNWSLDQLSAGVYTICVTVQGINPSEFERCFQVTVTEPSPLLVSSFFNKLNQNVSFDLEGGSTYEVTHNGKTTQTNSSKHNVNLDKGINNISISTGIECQGLFQQTYLNSYEVKYVPNPFKESLQFFIGGQDNIIEIGVYTSNGQLIDYQNISLPFGVRNYTLDTAKYKTGVYIINIKGATVDQSIQVIKE